MTVKVPELPNSAAASAIAVAPEPHSELKGVLRVRITRWRLTLLKAGEYDFHELPGRSRSSG